MAAPPHTNTPPAYLRLLAQPHRLWRWLRDLRHNPIYRRQRGDWGRPNPLFDQASRFAPFIFLGALIIGACGGWLNPALFSSQSSRDAFLACIVCLPAIMLNVLTWYGVIMAPALTAPAIGMEINAGTWDSIRTTPYSDITILCAKFLGAMARLRIWLLLGIFSLLHGLLLFLFSLYLSSTAPKQAISSLFVSGFTAVRPWLEIITAGILGMNLSTHIRSTTLALAASYAGILLIKLLTNNLLWTLLFNSSSTVLPIGGPILVYLLLIAALTLNLLRRAPRLGEFA
ncbi:MAG: hypothetical protein H6650_07815 [Ardenticatenales bacterium]|nr:hypothetical protein [Ardenticatenales bacterium]